MTWTAATAGVPAGAAQVTSYIVTAYAGSVARNAKATAGAATSATLRGLQGGTPYTFRVVAQNQFGAGPAMASAAVTPTGNATTYASTVLGDGPTAYYRLDDPTGVLAADSSGLLRTGLYDQNGTIHTAGGASALASDPDAATTLATSMILATSRPGLPQGSGARTLEGWFKTGAVPATATVVELNGSKFQLRVSGQRQLQVVTAGGTLSWDTLYPVNDNTWHLVEAAYDGTGSIMMYLDGVNLGSQGGAGTATTATGLALGGDISGTGNDYLTGGIDDVAVYNSVLSASQVAAHYGASGDTRPTSVPQAPQGAAATGGDGHARVSWAAPAYDGGSPITGYTVTPYIGTAGQTPITVGASTTTTTFNPLTDGTTYTFQVTAANVLGSSVPAITNAVTPAVLPGAPTSVTATATDARATVNWTAPGPPGNVVNRYIVTPYVGTTAQISLAVVVTTVFGGAVATKASVGGLTDGTAYTFQVTAGNDTGIGPPGMSAQVTPLGTAPLTLTPSKGYDSGSTPHQAVIADLTGTGWPGIVTTNGTGNNLSVLLNEVKGGGHVGGTFAQPPTLSPAGAPTSQVAAGDFNGDGKLDAAVVGGTPAVGVMLGTGNGTFAAESDIHALDTRMAARVVAVADLNGDGNLDLVVAGGLGNGSAVDVLLANGGGTFGAPVQYSLPDYCLGCDSQSTGLALADLNGDGRPDIVYTSDNTFAASDQGAMFFLLNLGAGQFTVTNPVPTPTRIPGLNSSSPGETVAVADINGDTIPDVVTVETPVVAAPRGITVSFGKGDGTFLAPVYVSDSHLTDGANAAGDVAGMAIADMNGDGLPDIVTADTSSFSSGLGGVSVYLNRGGGSIDLPTFIPTRNFSPRGLSLGDVNGDSEPDVVLENNLAVGPNVPANVLVLLNGTDFPPLGGALGANEMHACVMCQALRGAGAVAVSGPYPITVNSGEMSHTFTDLSMPARGFPLGVTQTYNDLNAATDAGLGFGWSSPLFMSLAQNGTTGITSVTQEGGGQAQFWSSSLAAVAPRTQATLVHNGDGTWTFTRYNSKTFTFNAAGNITAMSDLTGDTLSFGYTGSQVTSLTHSDGRSLTVAWTSGHISSITDATVSGTTRTASFTYDGSSQLTDIDWKVNGANDRNEHFEYESTPWNHGMTGMRDPRGVWVTQVYDAAGHTVSQAVDPTSKDPGGLNRTTTYTYTVSGGAISVVLITDPAGHQEQDSFAYGELVQKIKGYGTPSAATSTYSFDPSSVGTRMAIDANANTSWATYDAYGNPWAATDALGRTTSFTYTGNAGADARYNQPTTTTDGKGVVTTNSYDPTRRTLTQTSTPLVGAVPAVSQVIQYQHTTPGHPGDVTATIDGDGKTWVSKYNSFGDRTSTTDPLGNKASTTYNNRGWVLTTITPKGDPLVCTGTCTPAQYTTTYSYVDTAGLTNPWGAVTKVTDPLGHKVKRTYDNNNNVVQMTDGNNLVTNYDFDNANELTVTHRADPGSTTLKTDYNGDGTVADQVDGKLNTLQSYGYNNLAQPTTVIVDPGTGPHLNLTTTTTYDGVGNLLTKQNPGGSCTGTLSGCTTYTYDPTNQPATISYSDGATPNVTNVQYDGDGQRTALTDGTGTWAWAYDSLHRLTSATEGSNGTVGYTYNLRNLPTTVTYGVTGHAVAQGYDDAGRMNSVTDWNTLASIFNYDGNGNMYEADLASGTTLKDTRTFNAADQLTAIADTSGGSSVFAATYTRDSNAQVTSDSSATTSRKKYGYTALNQLCYAGSNTTSTCSIPPAGAQAFAYDAADNLITMGITTQSFNAADQLTASGVASYGYDLQGNRTTSTVGATVTSYGYDQANRLCWTGPTSAGAGCTAAAQASDTVYCYNGSGLRMAKVTGGSCASPTTSAKFTWDVSKSLPALLSDGATEYVYGPGGLPLEQVSGATTLWYHHDQLGSTRAITDSAGGVKASYTFDPYGNVLSCTGATITMAGVNICTGTISVSNPFAYAGQYRDAESGNYYLRARYYDPSTAQFLTLDPAVSSTMSPYAYVSGNPLNASDSTGLDPRSSYGAGEAGLYKEAQQINTGQCSLHADFTGISGVYHNAYCSVNDTVSNYSSLCFSTPWCEGCLSVTNRGHVYASGGPGRGTWGPSLSGGSVSGGSSDDLLNNWSVHAGGQYGVGGGYAHTGWSVLGPGAQGPYGSLGAPGGGIYWTFGLRAF